MFARDKYHLQDMMLADITSSRRDELAAKGSMIDSYLGMALEKPKGEED
jgi:hypothetical protein